MVDDLYDGLDCERCTENSFFRALLPLGHSISQTHFGHFVTELTEKISITIYQNLLMGY